MADKNKKKKVIDILNKFYSKINKIEAAKRNLEAEIQADQDQEKLRQAQEKLKNL